MHVGHLNRRDFVGAAARGILTALTVKGFQDMSLARTAGHASAQPGHRTGYVYDEFFMAHVLAPRHVETPERVRRIQAYLAQTGLFEHLVRLDTRIEPREPILTVHSPSHHASVQDCRPSGRIAALAVSRTLGAVQAVHEGSVRNAFCTVRPPGHHAHNNGADYDGACMGQGFCFYGNVAIAARYARDVLGYKRILICDWDYHYGNGTAWTFDKDPNVFFFSTHNWNAYPGSGDPGYTGSGAGKGYTLNVHLGMGSRDRDIIRAWDTDLARALEAHDFKPDLVLISAGFDSRIDDSLGTFAITDAGFVAVTKRAMAIADEHCGGRLVSCLEGGYNVDGLGRAVCAHVATLAGLDWRDFVPEKTKGSAPKEPMTRSFEVREGLLFVPDTDVGRLERVTVIDTSGKQIYNVPRAELVMPVIELDPERLSEDSFMARVHLSGGKQLEVPFRNR